LRNIEKSKDNNPEKYLVKIRSPDVALNGIIFSYGTMLGK
jgi:hypothetical protein